MFAATGREETTESIGFMVRIAYLEMGTWRMVASILCGFVGTILYYMGSTACMADKGSALGRYVRDIGFVLVGDAPYVGAIEKNERKDDAANKQNGAYEILYGIPIILFRCFHRHIFLS